ncbi:hypothetical protein BOX15_Mlig009806g1, partial [Macrostomum lignano]
KQRGGSASAASDFSSVPRRRPPSLKVNDWLAGLPDFVGSAADDDDANDYGALADEVDLDCLAAAPNDVAEDAAEPEAMRRSRSGGGRGGSRGAFDCFAANPSRFLSLLSNMENEEADKLAGPVDQNQLLANASDTLMEDLRSIQQLQISDLSGGRSGCSELDRLFAEKASSQPELVAAMQRLQSASAALVSRGDLSFIREEEFDPETPQQQQQQPDSRCADEDRDGNDEYGDEESRTKVTETGCQSQLQTSVFELSAILGAVDRLSTGPSSAAGAAPASAASAAAPASTVVATSAASSAFGDANSSTRAERAMHLARELHRNKGRSAAAVASTAEKENSMPQPTPRRPVPPVSTLLLDATAGEPSFNLKESFMRSTPIPRPAALLQSQQKSALNAGSAGSAPFLCLNRLALPDQVPVGSCHTAELSLTSCCDWRVELSISLAYCAEQVGNRFVTLATDQIPFALTPRLSLDARCSKPVLVKFAPRRSGFYLAEVLVQVASGASALPGCSRTVSLEAGGIGLRLVTPTGGQVTFDPPQSDLPVKQQQQMSQSRLVQLQNLSPEPATVLALLTCDSQAADDDVEFAFESAESAADVAEVQGDGRAIRLTVPGHSLAPLRLVCRRRRLGDSAAAAAAFDSRGRPPPVTGRLSIRLPPDHRDLLTAPLVALPPVATDSLLNSCRRSVDAGYSGSANSEPPPLAATVNRLVWPGVAMDTGHTQHLVLVPQQSAAPLPATAAPIIARLELRHPNFRLEPSWLRQVEFPPGCRRVSVSVIYSPDSEPGPHTTRLLVRLPGANFHVHLLGWGGAPQLAPMKTAFGVVNTGWPAFYWYGEPARQGVLKQGQSLIFDTDEDDLDGFAHPSDCLTAGKWDTELDGKFAAQLPASATASNDAATDDATLANQRQPVLVRSLPAALANSLRVRRLLSVTSSGLAQLTAACAESPVCQAACDALTRLRLSDSELRKLAEASTACLTVRCPLSAASADIVCADGDDVDCIVGATGTAVRVPSPSKTLQLAAMMHQRHSLVSTAPSLAASHRSRFELATSRLEFPQLAPGQEATEKVLCVNKNQFDLTVRVSQQPEAPFHLRKQSLAKFTLNQRNSGNYPFVFRPPAPGAYSCTVAFATGEGDFVSLQLTGRCVAPN